MAKVTFDYSKANLFIREHEMESMKDIVLAAKDKLLARTGAGNDFAKYYPGCSQNPPQLF